MRGFAQPSFILSVSLILLLGCGSEAPHAKSGSGDVPFAKAEEPVGGFIVSGGFFQVQVPTASTRRTLFTWSRLTFEDNTTDYAWIGG